MRNRFAVLNYLTITRLLCIIHWRLLIQIQRVLRIIALAEKNLEYFQLHLSLPPLITHVVHGRAVPRIFDQNIRIILHQKVD